MTVAKDQQIAKLKTEIERLKGEIEGLKFGVATRPYPYYVQQPVYSRPWWTTPTYVSPPTVMYQSAKQMTSDAATRQLQAQVNASGMN